MRYVVGAGGLDAQLPRNHKAKAAYCVLGEHLWVVGSFLCSARAYLLKSPWNASAWILWITMNQPPVSLLPSKSGNTRCCTACLGALGFVGGCKRLTRAPRAAPPRGFWSSPCCCQDMPYGRLEAGGREALIWCHGLSRAKFVLLCKRRLPVSNPICLGDRCICFVWDMLLWALLFMCLHSKAKWGSWHRGGSMFVDGKKA